MKLTVTSTSYLSTNVQIQIVQNVMNIQLRGDKYEGIYFKSQMLQGLSNGTSSHNILELPKLRINECRANR
jgi:hypothetical protein